VFAPAVAGVLALVAVLTHAAGVDVPAALYRIELFRSSGLTLWDSQWYGGHWTFDYSVLFGPVGAALGLSLTRVLCAVAAAWAFDRLVRGHFGPRAWAGSLAFAVATLVQVAIGQVPFALGEALALTALLCAQRGGRRRLALAPALALVASLASPLAGGFLALAALAWLIGAWPASRARAAPLIVAALAPIIALEVLFPGQGRMPFASANLIGMLIALAALALLIPARERTLRVGVLLYALVVLAGYALPSALGGNATRLGVCGGLALALCLPLQRRRSLVLLAIAAVPFVLGDWTPASSALLAHGDRSSSPAFFRPLLAYLEPRDRPLGRVEVVPTAAHWEAAYVAPALPLARGWERQLDTADNPIFYSGRLTAARYVRWLTSNGVRYVALADVPLDYAGRAEAALVRAGVPGLRLVWSSASWRVYKLAGAPGILSGPGRLLYDRAGTIRLAAARRGTLIVRERYSSDWRVQRGRAALSEAPGGWLAVPAAAPGAVRIAISL
jgi:hypothetical protein